MREKGAVGEWGNVGTAGATPPALPPHPSIHPDAPAQKDIFGHSATFASP